jgi:hypothetical protein
LGLKGRGWYPADDVGATVPFDAAIKSARAGALEHFPEKWTSGFPKKMRPRKGI